VTQDRFVHDGSRDAEGGASGSRDIGERGLRRSPPRIGEKARGHRHRPSVAERPEESKAIEDGATFWGQELTADLVSRENIPLEHDHPCTTSSRQRRKRTSGRTASDDEQVSARHEALRAAGTVMRKR
jgi:hypothetical protein